MNLLASVRPARRRSVLALLVLAIVPSVATADDAKTSPARLVPAQGLALLVEYDGVEARADAWKATATYAVFHKTPAGEAMASVARQVLDHLFAQVPQLKLTSAPICGLVEHVGRHGFLGAAYGSTSFVVVLRDLGREAKRVEYERLVRLIPDTSVPEPVQVRGRAVSRLLGGDVKDPAASHLVWWSEGDDLVVVAGPSLGGNGKADDFLPGMFDAIEGKDPSALTHPGRMAALEEGRDIAGFVPNGLFVMASPDPKVPLMQAVIDLLNPTHGFMARDLSNKVPDPDPAPLDDEQALITGLEDIKWVIGRWGFRDKALLTDVRIEMSAPRSGLLAALLDQPGFRTDDLPPVPKVAREVIAGSFQPAASYDRVIRLSKSLDPKYAVEIDMGLKLAGQAVRNATGQRLREDLLGHLGPRWCVFTTPFAWDKIEYPMPTLVVEIDDPGVFGKVLDGLASHANEALRGAPGACDRPSVLLERLPAPERGYRLASPEGVVPWLSDDLCPTLMLGEKYLVVAINPTLARAALAAESHPEARWQPGDEVTRTLAAFPARVTSLSIGDPRDSSWPETIATLPRLAQYLGNLVGAGEAAAAGPGASVLDLLGVPRPGAFRVRLDPGKLPKADQVRSHLFPSVLATVLDDRGLRFIGSEALPLGCIRSDVQAPGGKKLKIDLTNGFNVKFD
jgi:hypothetical protein